MFCLQTNFILICLKNLTTEDNAKEIANIITTDLMGLVDTREKREAVKNYLCSPKRFS